MLQNVNLLIYSRTFEGYHRDILRVLQSNGCLSHRLIHLPSRRNPHKEVEGCKEDESKRRGAKSFKQSDW